MRGSRRATSIAVVLAVIVVVGIAAFALSRTGPAALAWPTLRNATYQTSLVPRGAALRDGIYDVEAAPGSASRVIVRLADTGAFGDLDGDGGLDAAVILVSSGGGSGTFVELAAVRNDAGAPHPSRAALLGDRVLIREVRIDARRIVVRMRARGATDPQTLLTREITRTYELVSDGLVLRGETESEIRSSPAEDFVYSPQRIDLRAGASQTVGGSLAPGQAASYVVRGAPGQTLDLTVRSEFDNAVLSVSGLTDAIPLVSRRDYATHRTLTLSADQDYAVKVVSLAGYTLPFTLETRLGAAAATQPPRPTQSNQPIPSATPRPSAGAGTVPLAELSADAARFARLRPPVVGVAVVVPARGVVYAENADEQVPTASVVKVLVMLVALEQARQDHRPLTDDELALLWPMITESDNDATSELWERIGRGQAVSAYLSSIGVGGFTPDLGRSWGVSFVSARAMALVLGKLVAGTILDDRSRELALRMMEAVIPAQRWGVSAGLDTESERLAIKNGWYPGDEGWRVNSVGIVRPRSGDAYSIAIVTGARPSWDEGIETIEGVARIVNARLR